MLPPAKNELRWRTIQQRHEKGQAYTVGDRKAGGGTTPYGDEKSAELIEDRGDSEIPWRKRVRKFLITLKLEGCNRKERSCGLCLG